MKASPKLRWAGVIAFVVAIGLVVFMALRRHSGLKRAQAQLDQRRVEGLAVQTTHIRESPPFRPIQLIGEARPYAAVTLYAKVSGYMKAIYIDKGDHVQEGQILAVIESPETDKMYIAALATAANTRRIAARFRVLERRKLVSHQEAQQAYTNYDVARADLETQAALKAYENVRAPFSGTITDRFVDPGQLIQNGGSSTGALALVSIADLDRVRVYGYVDQSDAPFVHPGDPVSIALRERPNTDFRGEITRISGQLDPKTRMMLVETDLENRQRLIVPGSYVEMRMKVPTPPLMIAPTEALVHSGNRDFLVVVSEDHLASYRPVRIADNNGLELKISSGVKAGEEVVINVSDQLVPGARVQPRSIDAPAEGGPGGRIQQAGKAGRSNQIGRTEKK